jgi:hypothetical protein
LQDLHLLLVARIDVVEVIRLWQVGGISVVGAEIAAAALFLFVEIELVCCFEDLRADFGEFGEGVGPFFLRSKNGRTALRMNCGPRGHRFSSLVTQSIVEPKGRTESGKVSFDPPQNPSFFGGHFQYLFHLRCF